MYFGLKKLVIICTLLSSHQAFGQLRHFLDTMKYDISQRGKFYVGLDGKNNIVNDLKIKMFGLQGGFIYNKRTSVYMGLYFTSKEAVTISENYTARAGTTDSNTIYNAYGMSYLNFGTEYIFYNNHKWQLSVPMAIGLGSGSYRRFSQNKFYTATYPPILPLETGMNASYKLTWWLWLGGGLGTRISLNSTHYYNGPFYTFGLQIKTGAMVKKVKEAMQKQKEDKINAQN